ncbi:MAG: hypothetical protein AB1473_02555 [Thermodesulfobacteriota bacterium]
MRDFVFRHGILVKGTCVVSDQVGVTPYSYSYDLVRKSVNGRFGVKIAAA